MIVMHEYSKENSLVLVKIRRRSRTEGIDYGHNTQITG